MHIILHRGVTSVLIRWVISLITASCFYHSGRFLRVSRLPLMNVARLRPLGPHRQTRNLETKSLDLRKTLRNRKWTPGALVTSKWILATSHRSLPTDRLPPSSYVWAAGHIKMRFTLVQIDVQKFASILSAMDARKLFLSPRDSWIN